MPKNPFAPHDVRSKPPKRNSFDLSKQSFNTTEFGKILPVLCQEVIAGDSFEIDSSVACRAMPTVFPLQTRIRASLSYFYVRNRTLFKQWEDFQFKTKDVVAPYLQMTFDRAKKMISTGSLGDALGVPSTVGTSGNLSVPLTFSDWRFSAERSSLDQQPALSSIMGDLLNLGFNNTQLLSSFPLTSYSALSFVAVSLSNRLIYVPPIGFEIRFAASDSANIQQSISNRFAVGIVSSRGFLYHYEFVTLVGYNGGVKLVLSETFVNQFSKLLENSSPLQIALFKIGYRSDGGLSRGFTYSSTQFAFFSGDLDTVILNLPSSNYITIVDSIVDATEDSVIGSNPFVGAVPIIPLSALPFRAYEMIMNYFFRNDLNNPYVINGEVQYNQFIPTTDGGPDSNVYDFHYKNWEMDYLTSALQTPQFGEAPLVGLTFSDADKAQFEFQAQNGETYTAELGVDGDKLVSIDNYSDNIPSGNLRRLAEMINAGISINDLRNVNSFQRFLENTMRRGLRYRNQLKSHLGVSVDYPDIDVPQYIGGYSGYLTPGQNTNVADSPDAGLGDFNGSLGGTIQSSNKIRCYCPENGFIIGVYSLTPIPLYSQSIAKYLLKNDAFDYFQAEFSKIGFVPIHYSEVCPLQNTGRGESPSDVFGYQRAWYDYMANVDDAHGDFRTTLQQFTLGRTFAERPTLVEDFVRVKPEQLNNIFVTNNIADRYHSNAKFLLNIYHKIIALRPIPRNGVPSLE